MPIRPFPMAPPLPPKVPTPFQRPQIPLRKIADKHHIPPMPAIPAIGPTPRHMSLPPKAHAAITASPTLNPNLRLVVHASKRLVPLTSPFVPTQRNKTQSQRLVCATGSRPRVYAAE